MTIAIRIPNSIHAHPSISRKLNFGDRVLNMEHGAGSIEKYRSHFTPAISVRYATR
ncbi:hypothetical protein [Chamaesiphon sp. OTE_75_metabat_556]|uniref:hypothetical protein n=1 Tax=Chamaesiphon sp. OTE_75_metabat_556 TaxID=2964692 RepID=UPI00286A657B|nr:hypothetical protein [Chamaesiphon sp. OTE_75_metabat_556]